MMKLLILISVCLAPFLSSRNALALTFKWSFTDFSNSNNIIQGTISGLTEGSNDGTNLTITVDSTPTGEILGDGWILSSTAPGFDAFTVTNGEVTFANAFYERNEFNETLVFGGFSGPQFPFITQLSNSELNPIWTSLEPVNFVKSSQTIPEPSNILAILGLNVLMVKKLFTSKNY
ncbi:MAG: hypothetical protein WBM32_09990 [Crocosphaera sp.]